ncbi:hypothetical protein ACAS46_000899 [Vibrio vulnificus]
MTDILEMKLTATQAEWVVSTLKSRVNIREFVEVAGIGLNDLKAMRDRVSSVITEIENAGLIADCEQAIEQLKKVGVPIPKELTNKLKVLQGGAVSGNVNGGKALGKRKRKTTKGVFKVEGFEPATGSLSGWPSKEVQRLMDQSGKTFNTLKKEYFTPDSDE